MPISRRAVRTALVIGFDACAALLGVNAAIPRPVQAADSVAVSVAPRVSGGGAALTLAAAGPADLGPSSDPPWNPQRPAPRRRAWERVLTFPGRLASLPLTGLGIAVDHGLHYVEQSALIQRTRYVLEVVPQRAGISVYPAALGDRTGLGATAKIGTPFLSGQWHNFVSAEVSGSTLLYNSSRFRIGGKPLSLEYGRDWRPQEQFYGIGMETSEDSVSNYAAQQEFARAVIAIGWNAKEGTQDDRTRIQAWAGPRARIMRKGHESGRPSFEELFPAVALPTLDDQLENFVWGGSFGSDWRAGQPHWSQGWRVFVQWEQFADPPRWLAIRDARGHGATFTRWGAELETGFSFLRDPRSLRFLTRVVDQSVVENGERFMVADLAKLGGREGLWGFEPGRFQDLDSYLARVSYVFPLARWFEMDLHAEAGAVYPDVWKDLSPGRFEHSWGLALRPRSETHPFGSVGTDFSREGFRVRFALGKIE